MAGHLLPTRGCEPVASTSNQAESRLGRKTYFRTPPGGCGTAKQKLALVSPRGGTGVFKEGAQLVISFAFETIGARRLGTRAAIKHAHSADVLRTLGVVPAGMRRKSYLPNRGYLDQLLWTNLDDHWQAKVIWGGGKLH